MDIQRVNYVIERAIMALQMDEEEGLFEFSVPTPVEMSKRSGMKLPRKSRKTKEEPRTPVGFWSIFLGHKLTQWDMRQRDTNPYRMGHLLGAANKVDAKVKGVMKSTDDADIEKFRKAMKSEFERDFPPVKQVSKAIDKYLMTRKRPKIGK